MVGHWRSVLLVSSLTVRPVPARAQARGAFAREIDSLVARGGASNPRAADRRRVLERVFELAGGQPVWTRDGRPTREAHAVITALAESDARGLRPANYDKGALGVLAAALDRAPSTDSARLAGFEVAVSRGLIAMLDDLARGRVDPKALRIAFPSTPEAPDLASKVLEVSRGEDPAVVIAAVEPPYVGYAALQRALARYRALAADTSLTLADPGRVVRPNDYYRDAPRLRRLLLAVNDLSPTSPAAADTTHYAGPLVLAVMHFQRRHGLDADGILGAATMEELRLPLADRVRQIELALERWRWLPHRPPERYIVINIPAFRLYAFEHDSAAEHPVLSMNVIVGEAERRRDTPIFAAEMRELVFRPYWDVPPRIARTELVPGIRSGAIDMDREGYEIVSAGDNARVYAPTRANLAAVAAGTLRLRQRPGPGNALGLVKFVFPNDYSVYLHGTPATQLFSYARRDFSHGCIRAEQPTAIAEFALCADSGWTREAIENAMHGSRTLHVPLSKPLMVYVLYFTAVVAPDATVYFYRDLYDQDVALDRALGPR